MQGWPKSVDVSKYIHQQSGEGTGRWLCGSDHLLGEHEDQSAYPSPMEKPGLDKAAEPKEFLC